jgi:hypothetical protein
MEKVDEELIVEMLKNLSYDDILDFCKTNKYFLAKCNDKSSALGQLLQEKKSERAIASVNLEEIITEQRYRITVKIYGQNVVNGELNLLIDEEVKRNLYKYMQDNSAITSFVQDVQYTRSNNIMTISNTQLTVSVSIHIEFFWKILSVAEELFKLRYFDGFMEIYPDQTTSFISQ